MSLRWRLIRWAVVLAALGYAGHGLTALVADAGVLRVSHVVVHGNQRLSNGEVLALLDGLRGESILGTDLRHWRDQLLDSPWVADASLRRALPSTVDVTIAEREPFGVGRFDSGLYLIDERGAIVDEYGPNYAELDLPIIDGLAAPSAEGSLAIDRSRADLAIRLLRAVRVRNLGRHISQVDVTDAQNAVVILDGDPAWIRLGDDHFFERLQSYLDLAPALRARVPEIDYVDLRFDERVYVRPIAPSAARGTRGVDGARGLSLDRLPKGGRGSNQG
jgi:cell division protein FtsQ